MDINSIGWVVKSKKFFICQFRRFNNSLGLEAFASGLAQAKANSLYGSISCLIAFLDSLNTKPYWT